MANIGLYTGLPSSGAADGLLVGPGNPIAGPDFFTGADTIGAPVKAAARVIQAGYKRTGTFTIELIGSTADRWSLAPDSGGAPGAWGAWGAPLVLAGPIIPTNTIFWIRSRALSAEAAGDDTIVVLRTPDDVVAGAPVGRSWALPYLVGAIATVGRSWVLPYNVLNAVGKSWALPSKVNTTVGKSWALPYSIVALSSPTAVSVAANNDDAFRRLGGAAFGFNGNGNGVWNCAGRYDATYNKYGSAMRFTGVGIPQGATITSAILSGVAGTYDSASMSGAAPKTRFRAQAHDNPAQITDQTDFDSRILTSGSVDAAKITTSVDWDNFAALATGAAMTSPELKTIIQAIVNRAGWAPGNAILLFWDDFDGRGTVDNCVRYFKDKESGSPPTLTITWT